MSTRPPLRISSATDRARFFSTCTAMLPSGSTSTFGPTSTTILPTRAVTSVNDSSVRRLMWCADRFPTRKYQLPVVLDGGWVLQRIGGVGFLYSQSHPELADTAR